RAFGGDEFPILNNAKNAAMNLFIASQGTDSTTPELPRLPQGPSRCETHLYSKLPTESRARLSKRVYSPKNFSFTVPVGPFRCLPMMISARPLSCESLW